MMDVQDSVQRNDFQGGKAFSPSLSQSKFILRSLSFDLLVDLFQGFSYSAARAKITSMYITVGLAC